MPLPARAPSLRAAWKADVAGNGTGLRVRSSGAQGSRADAATGWFCDERRASHLPSLSCSCQFPARRVAGLHVRGIESLLLGGRRVVEAGANEAGASSGLCQLLGCQRLAGEWPGRGPSHGLPEQTPCQSLWNSGASLVAQLLAPFCLLLDSHSMGLSLPPLPSGHRFLSAASESFASASTFPPAG